VPGAEVVPEVLPALPEPVPLGLLPEPPPHDPMPEAISNPAQIVNT
jgi:hypothetical protein